MVYYTHVRVILKGYKNYLLLVLCIIYQSLILSFMPQIFILFSISPVGVTESQACREWHWGVGSWAVPCPGCALLLSCRWLWQLFLGKLCLSDSTHTLHCRFSNLSAAVHLL